MLRALLAGVVLGALAWKLQAAQQVDYVDAQQSADAVDVVDVVDDFIEQSIGLRMMGKWLDDLSGRGAPYAPALANAEARYGIPSGLLARLAWQESRFRADVVSGATVSGAGAVGIMQIVPKWHPGVDPRDPFASIDYAAKFLAGLYRQFGSWELALKAYNWGAGNVRAMLAGAKSEPLETRNYSSQILGDLVGVA